MKLIACALSLLALAACGSDPRESPNDATGGSLTRGGALGTGGGSNGSGGVSGASCTAAAQQLLTPIDATSTGSVTVLSDEDGIRTLFIDATAGGSMLAAANPRVYVNLEAGGRVEVTDETAFISVDWDLAIKRPILFTNSGDGGRGQGGALLVSDEFGAVASVDASDKTFLAESFFEADCTAKVDATGAVKTSFDGWYDYDLATNGLSPHAGTWLVKGGTGKLYKIQIASYYATADGGVGQAGGRYMLRVGAL